MIRSRKGQTVLPEYVVAFFLVIAALIAVTMYVQRAFQARVRDAKLYMVDVATQGCREADRNANAALYGQYTRLHCQEAADVQQNHMAYEYEPYYARVNSQIDYAQNEKKTLEVMSVFGRQFNQTTQVNSSSDQLPPQTPEQE